MKLTRREITYVFQPSETYACCQIDLYYSKEMLNRNSAQWSTPVERISCDIIGFKWLIRHPYVLVLHLKITIAHFTLNVRVSAVWVKVIQIKIKTKMSLVLRFSKNIKNLFSKLHIQQEFTLGAADLFTTILSLCEFQISAHDWWWLIGCNWKENKFLI